MPEPNYRPPARILWYLAALAVIVCGVFAWPFLSQPALVNVAPLCRTEVIGGATLNLLTASREHESALALTDGLWRPTHQFIFPTGSKGLRLTLPTAFDLHAINVFSPERVEVQSVVVRLWNSHGSPSVVAKSRSVASDVSSALLLETSGARATVVEIAFQGAPPRLNEVSILVSKPRIVGWLYVLTLTIGFSIVVGLFFMFGVIGVGSIAAGVINPDAGRILFGLVIAFALGLAWTMAPRSVALDAVFLVLWVSPAGYGVASQRALDPTLRRTMIWSVILLATFTQVESYAYGDDRVEPVDFLHAYFGAHRISEGAPASPELSSRPWLLNVIAAPWDHVFGRFGYWGYVGLMAGLNSLSIVFADFVLRCLGFTSNSRMLAWFVLLPGFLNLHFLGQRVLGGMLAVAAVTWLLSARHSKEPMRDAAAAGTAFTVGVGLHPSVAFVLISTAVLWVVRIRRRWAAAGVGLAVPAVLYMIWLVGVSAVFPHRRNDLLYYPLTTDFNAAFPATQSLQEVIASLDFDDWRKLLTNRLAHFRHYLFTDSWSTASWTWGRWISLPNVLCWATIPLLLLRRVWKGREEWCLWAILAPLLFHHAFIGQPHPQLHIGPAPFLALMILAAGTLAEPLGKRPWLERTLLACIATEMALRWLWPIYAAVTQWERIPALMRWFRLVAGDSTFCYFQSGLPTVCLLAFYWWVMRSRSNR